MPEPQSRPVAIIAGVGAERGVGGAVARRFAAEGFHVLVAGHTPTKIATVAAAIVAAGGSAEAVPTDVTDEAQVAALFDRAATVPDVVVFNAGNNRRIAFRDIDAVLFEDFWRVGCFAGFLVGREAARRLAPAGRGTIIFTGASGSLRGKAGFAAFSAAKAGLRAVAQSLAREFGAAGLHVAHVVIDGGIKGDRLVLGMPEFVAAVGEDGLLEVDAIAEAYWQLHRQHRSAWTHELDLRPFKEVW